MSGSELKQAPGLSRDAMWELAVWRMTDAVPHAAQLEAIRLAADSRYFTFVAGRRIGKTAYLIRRALAEVLRPNRHVWVVTPSFELSRRLWRPLRSLVMGPLMPKMAEMGLRPPRIIRNVDHTSARELEFDNGSWLVAKTADPTSFTLLGEGLDCVLCDEASRIDKGIWEQALMPALLDRDGKAVLASSPLGYGWFSDLYAMGQSKDPKHAMFTSLRAPSWLNPHLPAHVLKIHQEAMSKSTWRQEYGAEFAQHSGRVFPEFSRERHVRPVSWNPALGGICCGVDFGFRHSAMVAWQVVDDEIFQFDEVSLEQSTTHDLIEAIKAKPWWRQVEMIACDPAGAGHNIQSGLSDTELFQSAFPRARTIFSTQRDHRDPEFRSARLRDYLLTASGRVRFHVDPRCWATIRSLEESLYPDRGTGRQSEQPSKDNVTDHHRDAAGYALMCKFFLDPPKIWSRRPW